MVLGLWPRRLLCSGYVADQDGHAWEPALDPFRPLEPDGSITVPH
jgi:uncharacterized protein